MDTDFEGVVNIWLSNEFVVCSAFELLSDK